MTASEPPRPVRRFRRILKYVATVVLLLCGIPILLARVYSAAGWDRGPGKPTVGKETTYLTEPVDEEGFVDYAAALNAELRADVGVEDNAAVDVLRAVGPSAAPAEIRDEYFAELGIEPLPDEGDYFVDFAELSGEEDAEAIDALRDRHEIARRRPWSREEFPEVARWLEANERPLELALSASRKPRFYSPIVLPPFAALTSAPMPCTQAVRTLSRLLQTRSMARLHEGDLLGARDDLLAIRRFALLVDQGPHIVDGLVAIALDTLPGQCELLVAMDSRLGAEQFAAHRRKSLSLPRLRPMTERLARWERISILDTACVMARFGPGVLAEENEPTANWKPENIDWDVVCRTLNEWYDQLSEAASHPDPQQRLAQLEVLDDEATARGLEFKSPKSLLALLPFGRALRSRLMAGMLIALFSPTSKALAAAEMRATTSRALSEVAFALAAAHRADGKFPQQLAELVPAHLPKIPQDGFGRDLVYSPTENGFRLYSLGQNGIDETAATVLGDKTGDDLGLGYPLE